MFSVYFVVVFFLIWIILVLSASLSFRGIIYKTEFKGHKIDVFLRANVIRILVDDELVLEQRLQRSQQQMTIDVGDKTLTFDIKFPNVRIFAGDVELESKKTYINKKSSNKKKTSERKKNKDKNNDEINDEINDDIFYAK